VSSQEEVDRLRKEMDDCEKCDGHQIVMASHGYIWCPLCVMTVRKLNIARAKLQLKDMCDDNQRVDFVLKAAREAREQAKHMAASAEEDLLHIYNLILRACGYEPDDIIVTENWNCEKSPLGVCFYDQFEDPCHDRCLICGDPEERK